RRSTRPPGRPSDRDPCRDRPASWRWPPRRRAARSSGAPCSTRRTGPRSRRSPAPSSCRWTTPAAHRTPRRRAPSSPGRASAAAERWAPTATSLPSPSTRPRRGSPTGRGDRRGARDSSRSAGRLRARGTGRAPAGSRRRDAASALLESVGRCIIEGVQNLGPADGGASLMPGSFVRRRASALVGGLAALAMVTAVAVGGARQPSPRYLFSYFTGNGEDGLHLAWSADGLTWTTLRSGASFLAPEVGSKLMRD